MSKLQREKMTDSESSINSEKMTDSCGNANP